MWRISVRTERLAFLPYFLLPELLRPELLLLGILFLPF
jgi:hypothetical protein